MRLVRAIFCLLVLSACEPTAPAEFPIPIGVSALGQGGSITVRWHEPQAAVTKYEVEYSSDAVAWFALKETGAAVLTVTHGGVQYKQQYYYRVRACGGAQCSDWVVVSAAWENGQPPLLEKPVVVKIGTSFATLIAEIDYGGLATFVTITMMHDGKVVYRSPAMQYTPLNNLAGTHQFSVTPFGLQELTEYTVFAEAQNPAGVATSAPAFFKTGKSGIPTVRADSARVGVRFTTGLFAFRLFGTVDPGGEVTTSWYEVAPLGENFSESSRALGFLMIPQDGVITSPPVITAVTGQFNGLIPGSRYKWRLVAVNSAGRAETDTLVFTVPD